MRIGRDSAEPARRQRRPGRRRWRPGRKTHQRGSYWPESAQRHEESDGEQNADGDDDERQESIIAKDDVQPRTELQVRDCPRSSGFDKPSCHPPGIMCPKMVPTAKETVVGGNASDRDRALGWGLQEQFGLVAHARPAYWQIRQRNERNQITGPSIAPAAGCDIARVYSKAKKATLSARRLTTGATTGCRLNTVKIYPPHHWRQRARELRNIAAEGARDPDKRSRLLQIADEYDVLARRADERANAQQKGRSLMRTAP
jgi:hypothetical protein